MPLFRSAKDVQGTASAVAAVSQGVESVQTLAADGGAKFELLKEEAEEKLAEATALKATLEGDSGMYPKVVAVLKFFQPCLKGIWTALCCLIPLYSALFKYLFLFYEWAPKKLMAMIFGAVLCFFGGTYVASLAAVEAFLRMGGERLWGDIKYVYEQVKLVGEATLKDEEKAGGLSTLLKEDGTLNEDVPPAELLQRRIFVVMVTLKEPGRLENAVGSLWSAYVAVLATLSLQFAQVAALALGMAAAVKPTVDLLVSPVLTYVLDPSLHHWVASLINSTLNFVAMCVAWYLMAVVAAVYAGLKGGRMFADAAFGILADYGLIEKIPSELVRSWFDPKTSYLDEAIMYTLAGFGIYTQVFSGFAIFFPLNIVLLPLSALEWFLRFQITFGGTAPAS